MKTLVLENMPELFWEEIEKKNYKNFFNIKDKKEAEILIIRTKTVANKEFIDTFPNLKLIIRAGTGLDNIDIDYAYSKGINLQNTPKANSISAYEHTIALIFSLIKKLPQAHRNILNKKWKQDFDFNFEISDLKVLVVGVGRIGSMVAKTLKYLGAKVFGVDPYLSEKDWQKVDIQRISYEEGLKKCNLITFHCPLTPETKNYFSRKSLNQLKNPIFLLNVARGGIVEEDAISKGFKRNIFLGVALDVFTNEPWTPKDFANENNIILTPHIGAYTKKAKNRMALETIKVWENFVFSGILTYEIKRYD